MRNLESSEGRVPEHADDQRTGVTLRSTLEKETGVGWRVDIAGDGTILLDPRSPPPPLSTSPARAQQVALRFLTDHGAHLGLERGSVRFVRHELLDGGRHVYVFGQRHGGVDVPEGHLDVVLTETGAIDLVIGRWVRVTASCWERVRQVVLDTMRNDLPTDGDTSRCLRSSAGSASRYQASKEKRGTSSSQPTSCSSSRRAFLDVFAHTARRSLEETPDSATSCLRAVSDSRATRTAPTSTPWRRRGSGAAPRGEPQ